MTSNVVITNRDRSNSFSGTAGPGDAGAVLRIGVISDTHGLLLPKC